jgi:predicted transcriptional regulator
MFALSEKRKGNRGGKMRRRSWPEITTDILETTITPSNKMRIMYRSNLNFERFNKYFYGLLRKGFIEENNGTNGRQVYKITETGRTLLDVLRQAQKLISGEEA